MRKSQGWKPLISTFVTGHIMSGIKSSSLSSVLYQVARDLRMTGFESGVVLSAPSATGALFGLGGGVVTDRLGIKKMFNLGVLLMALGVLLMAFSVDFCTLYGAFLLASFGVTIYVPPTLKFLATIFHDRQRGLALGILGLTVRMSAGLVFLSIPLILGGLGSWRWVFVIFGAISLLLAALIYYNMRGFASRDSDPKASANPSIRSELMLVFRTRSVILTATMRVFLSGSSQSLSAFLPFLLQLTGSSLLTASLTGTVYWICQASGAILIPKVSDVLNRRALLVTIISPVTSIMVLVMALTWSSTLLTLIAAGALGFMLAGLVEVTWLIPLADPKIRGRHAGVASGVLTTIGAIGGISSTLIVGSLIDVLKQNIWPVLVFIAALQAAMMFVSLFLKEPKDIS